MAMTLAQFILTTRDQLIAGVVEDIYTTNPMYNFLPWIGYTGSGISVNREDVAGDAEFLALDGTITAKTPSDVAQVLYRSTTAIGDAEINKQQIAESSSDINDVIAREVSSKAKAVGRLIQGGIATGTGTAPSMNSLHSMIDSSQYTPTNGVGGAALTFDMLDALIDLVKSKDGQVDWLMANGRDIRALRTLYRALGGVPIQEVAMGARTIAVVDFNGIPVFQNDYLSVTETDDGAALTGGAQSSIYAGNWDDGSMKTGVAMVYPEATVAGVSVEDVGAMESKDESIYRVKAYMNFATFNRRGVARLTGIVPA